MKTGIGAGLTAAVAVAVATGTPVAGETICFEAESAATVSAPMNRVTAATTSGAGAWPWVEGASGNAYLEVEQGKGNPPEVTGGEAEYRFEVKRAGTYVLWCRVWWLDECGNSLSLSLDGNPKFTFGQDGTYRCWHWVKSPPALKQLDLSAGRHLLTLSNREDGVRIDQILLVDSRRYVPVDIETVTPAK